jgi:hypothetical protein
MSTLELAASWINSGDILIEGKSIACELTDSHKHVILKNYCASKEFTH